MGKGHISVPMSVFWSRASTKDIYKDSKDSNSIYEKTECTSNNLSGRYTDFRFFSRGTLLGQRYIDFSVAKFGLFDQHQKVTVSGNT